MSTFFVLTHVRVPVHSIDSNVPPNFPTRHSISQNIEESSLATSRGSHQGHDFSPVHVSSDVLQQLFAFLFPGQTTRRNCVGNVLPSHRVPFYVHIYKSMTFQFFDNFFLLFITRLLVSGRSPECSTAF